MMVPSSTSIISSIFVDVNAMLEVVNIPRFGLALVGAVLLMGGVAFALRAPVPATSNPGATAAPGVVRVTPLTLRTTDGLDVAVPTAGRPTIVYFMAAWCVSCLQGATNLAQLDQDYHQQGLQVLVIDADPTERPSDLERFKSLAGNPRYFWAMDDAQKATQAYSVRSLDATILVSGSGEVLFRSESLPNPNTLRRAVQKALGL
jgi:thiol-disulfide isomerase/thioredoxin